MPFPDDWSRHLSTPGAASTDGTRRFFARGRDQEGRRYVRSAHGHVLVRSSSTIGDLIARRIIESS